MRQIKFRAWDNQQKEMREDWRTFGTENGLLEIMQFTGLFDRHGKEIYEGDILGYWGTAVWQVQWDEEKANFCFTYPNGLRAFAFSENSIKGKKVIGNIYSTPELLSGN